MIRKVLAVGIILLFVGTCIIPTMAQNEEKSQSTSRGNWLYVGGSGPGNYTRIQDAIDNASDGDTIFVFTGIYGNVTIDKSLQLIGENKYSTIISGSGEHNAASIEANQVTMTGFTIQNRGSLGKGNGIRIEGRTNITISDMILTQNSIGINYFSNINILLDDITFSANGLGISFYYGKNCIITRCIFSNNGIGIFHCGFSRGASGASLYIKNNFFLNNSAFLNDSAGISLIDCIDTDGNTTIEGNSFQHNINGIITDTSTGVNVLKNNFVNNTRHIKLSRISFIREILSYLDYKQHWMNNYWDDWNQNQRYSIHGFWTLLIGNNFKYIPILRIPYKEFDSNPAQEPYDITGMT